MMKMYGVCGKAICRDSDIIGEELPVDTKQGYDEGYLLADGVGQHQNSLMQEQPACVEKVAVTCGSEDKKIVLLIIHELGSYCGGYTWKMTGGVAWILHTGEWKTIMCAIVK